MDYTLIAAIIVVLLVIGLFLLRKSSKKDADSTLEATTAGLDGSDEESTGNAVVEEVDESFEDILEQEVDIESEDEQAEITSDTLESVQDKIGEEAEIITSPVDEGQPAEAVTAEQDESIEEIVEQEVKQESKEEEVEVEPEEIESGSGQVEKESKSVSESPDEQRTDEVEDVVATASLLEEAALPSLTIEIYETRLRLREEQQQRALADAINQHDDIKRDHLQIELVAITDKLALLADSYNEEIKWRREALAALEQFQEELESSEYEQARESLLSGETEAAERVFSTIIEKNGSFAAKAAYQSGRLAEGRVDLYLAMERYRVAVDKDATNCEYLQAAGVMARKLYRYRDAMPWLQELVQLLQKKDEDNVELALARRELGYIYALNGQFKQAGPLYKQAMKALSGTLGQNHLEMGLSWYQIAELQEAKGQYDQAEPTYCTALSIMEKELGEEHPGLDHILEKMAGLNSEIEEDAKAAELYQRLCSIREKSLGLKHPKLAMSLQLLAEAYRLQGQYEISEKNYRQALAIMEENHGKNHPAVAAILQELAKLCSRQKRNDEAERLQQRASEIFQQSIQGQEENINEEDLNLQGK